MTSVAILKSQLAGHGGLEKYTRRLVDAFVERGCEVSLLSTGFQGAQPDDFDIINLGPKAKLSVVHLRQFERWSAAWLKNHPHDVVFGMDRGSGQTHHRAGNGVHAAYLKLRMQEATRMKRFSLRYNPLHRTILGLERRNFEGAELRKLFCNSNMVRRQVLEYYKINPSKLAVIHNGVEWTELQEDFDTWQERRDQVRLALGLDPQAVQLLYVGHGFRRKGLLPLMEGLSRLAYEPFQLSVVGQDKEQRWFEVQAERLGISNKVKFFGQRNNIRSFYQMADCLTLPSSYDPFANVTVEALAMGLFVLTSAQNGASEIINSETGVIVEQLGDLDCMVAALRQALQRPKTPANAQLIRSSVKSLEFGSQLGKIVDSALA